MLEYVGLSIVVAGVLVAISAALVGIPEPVRQAVCTVTGGERCDPAAEPRPRPPREGPTGNPKAGPEPSPSAQASATPPPEEERRQRAEERRRKKLERARRETEAALQETQLGRDAVQWAKDHDIKVVYYNGPGSYYRDSENTFYVDVNQSVDERANTYVHEMNHARHDGEPDPDDMDRQPYIDASIREETDGTVLEIRNNQQLREARGTPNDPPDTLMQAEYEKAYKDAVDRENAARARNQRPPMTPEQERRVGEEAGWKEVNSGYYDGRIVQSTDQKSYEESNGEEWDDAHDCTLWIFC